MFETRRLEAVRIEDAGAPEPWAPAVQARIDALWADALRRRPELVDGEIFCLRGEDPERALLRGSFYPYSAWLAQREDAALAELLALRPLAVSGVTRVEGCLVFGKRGTAVTQNPGLWEPVPAGGIDREASRGGVIDARAQILSELEEELGVERALVTECRLVGLADDHESRVTDLVFALDLGTTAAELLEAFHARAQDEYSELRAVAREAVGSFLDSEATPCAPMTAALVELAPH